MPKASEIFGELTFSKKVMKDKLGKEVYQKLLAAIESGEPLDQSIAGDVAHAMKEWAIERGATHFTHWFQPHRGGTAEKHDAFITYDENHDIIDRFSASQLIQSEPDASSFPSGGMRSTFEARGYTAWDPTSPAFLIEAENSSTLVIPSVYLSWDGNVLDIKTPMLRSQRALNQAVMKVQRLLGNRLARRIKVYLGPEQEYFLVSKSFYKTRPDLEILGRTIFGAPPVKGQQMEDHYFGAIKGRVLRFMEDLDHELYRSGIPTKTRHNEVAPNQFEVAPLYEEANLAVDHNLQLMETIRRVADKHDLVALLLEKPFAGVNGSGKHLNWSLWDNTGTNYLEPSKSPLKNINFLVTIGALLLGVDRFGGLLRASIADAENDFRLGANEAPPAIMSVYLGSYLSGLLDEIEGIGKLTEKKLQEINLGVQNLPKIAKDISDRNRTSPLAFTGNKFEFRAVGSSQNCSLGLTIINLIVAYGFDQIYERLSTMKGDPKNNAILVLKDVFKQTRRIRFEGNNYSEEWKQEAAKRGLPDAHNTPKALEMYLKKETSQLFETYEILSEKELHSKIDIRLETYNKIKEMEFKTAVMMSRTMVLPALAKHISSIASAAYGVQSVGIRSESLLTDVKLAEDLYRRIKDASNALEKSLTDVQSLDDIHTQAYRLAEDGIPKMDGLRQAVDHAELIVADELWPMAKYKDLLNLL
ncbi:MAG: glutamine synthetase III [Candidatus Delongbacteria bacterium]|nr:glutamine synthetase III [Candidatus Delongbacteria bacterium]